MYSIYNLKKVWFTSNINSFTDTISKKGKYHNHLELYWMLKLGWKKKLEYVNIHYSY